MSYDAVNQFCTLHHIRTYHKCEWYHGIKTTYHRQICDVIRPVDYNFLRQFLIYDFDCASVASLEFKVRNYRKVIT